MHDKWEEMIPFYLNGTLPALQRSALEQHLDTCDECRRSLGEWHTIANAIRAEADAWARTLPLMQNGRMMTSPRTAPIRRVKTPRRLRTIAALAAAVFAVVVLGALVFIFGARGDPTATPTGTLPAIAILPTSEDDATSLYGAPSTDEGIIQQPTWTPIITPTPTPTLSGSETAPQTNMPTPVPSQVVGVQPISATPTAVEAFVYGTPLYGCSVVTASDKVVNIYRYPSLQSDIVGVMNPGDFLSVYTTNGQNWYELIAPGSGLLGWVPGTEVQLLGADCANLPLPSPTYAVTPGVCMATSYGNLLLHGFPGEEWGITGRIAGPASVNVIARGDNSWVQVQAFDGSIGWVQESELSSYGGDCSNLPFVSYTQTPPPTPVPTETPLPTPIP